MTEISIQIGPNGQIGRIVSFKSSWYENTMTSLQIGLEMLKEFYLSFYKYMLISVAVAGVIFFLIIVGYCAGYLLNVHENQHMGFNGYCISKECEE